MNHGRVLNDSRHLLRNAESFIWKVPSDQYNQMHYVSRASVVEISIEQQSRTVVSNGISRSSTLKSSSDVRPRVPRQNERKVGSSKVKIDRTRFRWLLDLGFTA